MERMEEYAEEEYPFTEAENLPRNPIPEDFNYQFLRTITNSKRPKI